MEIAGIKARESNKWKGEYNGVRFEVVKWSFDDCLEDSEKIIWNFYLFISIPQLPVKLRKQFWLKGTKKETRVSYDYYKSPVADIEFHYGCTYYAKTCGFDGDKKIIQVGCDYNHYWDEGHEYRIEEVLLDVKAAINSFWELVPDYKCRCHGTGKFYRRNKGTFNGKGAFFSNEYHEQRKKEKASVTNEKTP